MNRRTALTQADVQAARDEMGKGWGACEGPRVIITPEGTFCVSEYRTFVDLCPADGGPVERRKLSLSRGLYDG